MDRVVAVLAVVPAAVAALVVGAVVAWVAAGLRRAALPQLPAGFPNRFRISSSLATGPIFSTVDKADLAAAAVLVAGGAVVEVGPTAAS